MFRATRPGPSSPSGSRRPRCAATAWPSRPRCARTPSAAATTSSCGASPACSTTPTTSASRTWTTPRTATRARSCADLEERDAPAGDGQGDRRRTPTSWACRPSRTMEQTLVAVDELCGFLVACAAVRPEGIHGLTPKSVKKKLKQPSFAAAVNREEIREAPRRSASTSTSTSRSSSPRSTRAPTSSSCTAAKPRRPGPWRRSGACCASPMCAGCSPTALLARLPYGIEGLATVLFVQEEKDSFAAAGLVSAAFAIVGRRRAAGARAGHRRARPDARPRRRGRRPRRGRRRPSSRWASPARRRARSRPWRR